EGQRNAVERQHAGEPFGDPVDLDDMSWASAGHAWRRRHRRPPPAVARSLWNLFLGDFGDVLLRVHADAGVEIVDRLATQELHQKVNRGKALLFGGLVDWCLGAGS